MPYTIHTAKAKIRDAQDHYRDIDVFSDDLEGALEAIGRNNNQGARGAAVAAVQTIADNINTSTANQLTDASAVANMVAQQFNAANTYKKGDYVRYTTTSNGITINTLYKLTADHAANVTWPNTSKVEVKLSNDVVDLKSAVIAHNSANLYNPANNEPGSIKDDGTINQDSLTEWKHSELIYVGAGNTFSCTAAKTYKGTDGPTIACYYNANKEILVRLEAVDQSGVYTHTMTSQQVYVAFNMNIATVPFMMNMGDTLQSYDAYGGSTLGYALPEYFGAVGDGETDDTAAFAGMFEVADKIFIPAKTYKISTVNVPAKDIQICGEGSIYVTESGIRFNAPTNRKTINGISFELDDDATCAIGFYGDSSTTAFNSLILENIRVESTLMSDKIAIDIRSENEALLSNISVRGCCINVINSMNPSITNCVCRHSAIGIYNANTDSREGRQAYACGLKISNATILGCTIGIKTVECDSIQITNSMIDYNDYPIINIGTGEAVVENCFLSSRNGYPVVYVDKNNNNNGVFGGNGFNTESANDFKLSNCYVVQHDEDLDNAAIILKNGFGHIISGVTVAYGGKSCIELHDVTLTSVTDCNLRSGISGGKALVSFKNNELNDDSSNSYHAIRTSLPIYVRNANTDINANSFVTKRFGSVVFQTSETSKTINPYIPQGVDYVYAVSSGLTPTFFYANDGIHITIPEHESAARVSWIAVGKNTHTGFTY